MVRSLVGIGLETKDKSVSYLSDFSLPVSKQQSSSRIHRFIQVLYFIWQLSLVSFRRFAQVQRKLRSPKNDKIARCDACLGVEGNYFQHFLKILYCLKKRGSRLMANSICGERRATYRQEKRVELSSDEICPTYKHLYSRPQSNYLKSILIIILRQLAASSVLLPTLLLISEFSRSFCGKFVSLSLCLSLHHTGDCLNKYFPAKSAHRICLPLGFILTVCTNRSRSLARHLYDESTPCT